MQIISLGSGSSGNSIIVCDRGEALIVDLGFSRAELKKRCRKAGFNCDALTAALITHEHGDHCKGCRVFCDSMNLPLYASNGTVKCLRASGNLPSRVFEFLPGDNFTVGNFEVVPFSVPHDAEEPVGYEIISGETKVGIATDLGHVNAVAKKHLSGCDALVIESNYDLDMLGNSARPLMLKRRIAGRGGHLDNRETAAVLPELVTERTRLVMLAHMSRECNELSVLKQTFSDCRRCCCSVRRWEVLPQDDVTAAEI